MCRTARVAQSVERGTFNPKVQGSSPCPGDSFYHFCSNICSSYSWKTDSLQYVILVYIDSEICRTARVAQSVERGTFNPKVQGSSPCPGDSFNI